MTSREISFFDVSFKDATATYKAGDVVAGNVTLVLTADLKMKGVKMFLQGVSRINWDEKRSSQVNHKNMEVYLDEAAILCSRVQDSLMRKGRHEWPFNIRLPSYLPATFEGQYGKVSYWAKVCIDQPWKKDTELTKPFTVLGSLDLNTEADSKTPVESTQEVEIGALCCRSGVVTAQLSLQKRGFVSGGNIPFFVRLTNKTTQMFRDVQVSLIQHVTYRADRVKKTSTVLKGKTWRDINPGEKALWDGELTNIPNVVPSRLGGGCKNIEVKYLIQLTGHPKGMGKGIEVPVELIIGTVPIRKTEAGEPVLTVKAAKNLKLQEGLTVEMTNRGQVRASPSPSPNPSPALPRRSNPSPAVTHRF